MQVIKSAILFSILIANLIFPVFTASADEANKISVQSEIDRAFFTIGDRVNYQIRINHPANVKVVDIDTKDTLQDFEIKDENNFEEKNGDIVTTGKKVIITSFSIGEYVLAPAVISYQDSDGTVKKLISNKLYVSVESVDKAGRKDEDIHGVKGVVQFRSKLMRIFIWILIFAGTLGIVIVTWLKMKKDRFLTDLTSSTALSPHEEAYRSLHELADSDLIKRGMYKTYFSKMSEIIRRYLERRFEILALESTTAELSDKLKSLELDRETCALIERVLNMCDLVKFAKHTPAPLEVIQSNKEAVQIIDVTKKMDEPIPEGTDLQKSNESSK